MPSDERVREALAPLFRGYLHQDYRLNYRSAREAARAFAREACEAERLAAADALRVVLSVPAGQSLGELRLRLAALGLAWRPPSRAALQRLLEAVEAEPGRSSLSGSDG